MTGTNLDSWDGFLSTPYLKEIHVTSEQQVFVVGEVMLSEQGRPKLILLDSMANKSYYFDLNVTNSDFLKEAGIANPTMLMGKKLFFKKEPTRNPSTGMKVMGLRIHKVE